MKPGVGLMVKEFGYGPVRFRKFILDSIEK
jgi:hypothetical protein